MQEEATIPENAAALAAQSEWVKAGKRRAMLVPFGSALPPFWPGAGLLQIASGLVIYNPAVINHNEIARLVEAGQLGALLDYPVDGKPDRGVCVTIRDRSGREKMSVVAPDEKIGPVGDCLEKLKDPTDTVAVESPEKITGERLADLDRHNLIFRRLEGDPVLQGRVEEAGRADNHRPLYPTHAVLKGDTVVGYVGLDSLPLCRIWLMSGGPVKPAESVRLIQTLENLYRMRGLAVVATIMNVQSPFYQVRMRLGYLELPGDRLMLRIL